jgi:hypothetical protein
MDRLKYISKEREGRLEGWLKITGQVGRYWKWEKPAPLIGPRWSPMRGLEDLIKADASTEARLHVVKLPTVHATDEAKQAAIAAPLEAPSKRIEATQVKVEPQGVPRHCQEIRRRSMPATRAHASRLAHGPHYRTWIDRDFPRAVR